MTRDAESDKESQGSSSQSAPQISLPTGGGAIRGIGEKFTANPVTGTGSISVPVATSPGRSGFGPQLSLSYDSGAGNGPFGLGWSLGLPQITRKTDKGLPQYNDADESDVFILSGAEDLVPVFEKDSNGDWSTDPSGRNIVRETDRDGYRVRHYRPRVEGLFARIECWTNRQTGETHWRSISRDNVSTLYGRTNNSRIFDPDCLDPEHPTRIFSWLICESFDDKGNGIVYDYKVEDSEGVDESQVHEKNRAAGGRSANRYLKSIKYGNRVSRLVRPELTSTDYMFEVTFDYGEHDLDDPKPSDPGVWHSRDDPFSSYRSGFEVRTYRLCRRVLMFHHFPEEAEVGQDCLVRSTDLRYRSIRNAREDPRRGDPAASFISSIVQRGYKRKSAGYLTKSLPPLEFEYSEAIIHEAVHDIDATELENLPIGVDGTSYRWVDLDGEGVSGMLTEQGNSWFYKPSRGDGRFGRLQTVAAKPAMAALSDSRQQFLDLAGDGQLDLVEFGGPTPGFHERTTDENWEPFRPFAFLPNVAWDEPNRRFVDLSGDGHADVLITEQDVITWHPSLAEDGFGPARRVHQQLDEEQGPRLVFADGSQSIYLADMCGDGLADLVRIRNGDVCYWPNLGYGRFGRRVVMGNAPCFDHPDQFSQLGVRLADVDGSGTSDIIYIGRHEVTLYFNESGNRWSEPRPLHHFPRVDNLSSVMTADLLGNGTTCLVWSSPLPGDVDRQMRYVDLMGGLKPHLMVSITDNLGAETHLQYAPSTKFYLADKAAGRPWITKLPFPVHVVEKKTVHDRWRDTRFVTTYSYHHGYFDGEEREFRGFGRVEQTDVEDFGTFAAGNTASPYITADQTLYQPPVKTITWVHTGAALDQDVIETRFREEYFAPLSPAFAENELPDPDLDAQNLSAEEWGEARRACKGMTLRQEVYELDVDALALGQEQRVKLFSTAFHNCQVQNLQPRGANRHAVFLVTESEAITYTYELDLGDASASPDPRVSHTLNLRTDEYGNTLEAVAVAYPRVSGHGADLPADAAEMIGRVQQERHLTYTENHFTNDAIAADHHRLRQPCETKSYELTGIAPRDGFYFTLAELREARIGETIAELQYHVLPSHRTPEKRLVEHARMLFFDETLSAPLPFSRLNRLALPFETYRLVLTDQLLSSVFAEKLDGDSLSRLRNADLSGYLNGGDLAARFTGADVGGQYWTRSGIAGFTPDAVDRFYLPERYTGPFGHITRVQFDSRHLYVESSTDALGNTTRVSRFDFRVLAARELQDSNDNLSEVYFDILGMPTAMAVTGKDGDGDGLSTFDDELANPPLVDLVAFSSNSAYNEEQVRQWLGDASARHVYHFGEVLDADGTVTWGAHPACALGVVRTRHVSQLAPGQESPLQAALEYSDGSGAVVVTKAQAEPAAEGNPLRWIANGRTVLNNKGKPVKQYEPYFSVNERGEPDHGFEEPRDLGVTPVMHYDAAGRLIRTDAPDGSHSRADFSPWHVATFDANDTVLEPGNTWNSRNAAGTAEDQRSALLATKHAGTPAVTHLDSLGREVVAVAHNRSPDDSVDWANTPLLDRPWIDEIYVTMTKLDFEGKPLWIRDARGNRVMQYITPAVANDQLEDPVTGFVPCYDIAGNLLFQHSMDAGDRWMLADAAGQPMLSWDYNERQTAAGPVGEHRRFVTEYDELHRPVSQRLRINGDAALLVERFRYGESLAAAESRARNLRGRVYEHIDPSGRVRSERFDFKGNPVEMQRNLATAYDAPAIDWSDGSPTAGLEGETFSQITEYDALDRMARQYSWHRGTGSRVAVYEPRYNERGLLAGEDLVVGATKTSTGYDEVRPAPDTGYAERVGAIQSVTYNVKGQREGIRYGNYTDTRYDYDPQTFRLRQLRTTRPTTDLPFPAYRSNLTDEHVVQQLSYTYEAVGNITEIYDEAYEPVFFRNQRVEPHSRYVYDALYRLIEAEGRENYGATGAPSQRVPEGPAVDFPITDSALRNYTQRYAYDTVGNFREMRHVASGGSWTRRYETAPDSNRLASTDTDDPARSIRYDYDTHGSMLNLNSTPEEFRLRWDYRDMIHTVDLGGGGRAWYNYDANKQRTRKRVERVGSTVEERLYLGGMELYRRWVGDRLVEEIESHHLFVDAQRMLLVDNVLLTDNGRLGEGTFYRYQYGNHLGSITLELDAHAAIASYEEYHPYGSTAYEATGRQVRVTARRYRYTAMERDDESGLRYHGARYYLAWLGAWASADPVELADGLNLYRYTQNNPLMYVDLGGSQAVSADERYLTEHGNGAGEEVRPVILVLFTGANLSVDVGLDAEVGLADTTRQIGNRIEEAVGGERIQITLEATPVRHEQTLLDTERFVREQVGSHPGALVIIYGHSRGGHTALDLSRRLEQGETIVPVDLLLTTDAAMSFWSADQNQSVPGNVGVHLNWYQDLPTRGWTGHSFESHGAPHYPNSPETLVYNRHVGDLHEDVDNMARDEVVQQAVAMIESGVSGVNWVPDLPRDEWIGELSPVEAGQRLQEAPVGISSAAEVRLLGEEIERWEAVSERRFGARPDLSRYGRP